jgi:hypothetical protein
MTPSQSCSKLGALHLYQLSIPPPGGPRGSFDSTAAGRGEQLFAGRRVDVDDAPMSRSATRRGRW